LLAFPGTPCCVTLCDFGPGGLCVYVNELGVRYAALLGLVRIEGTLTS